MNLDFIWESLLLVTAGVLLLRLAGRKSISQMTIAQTVVMISIGSIIIQPIIERSVWKTVIASAIFIGALILMEYLQVKSNKFENFITGKSKIVIQNGQIQEKQLSRLRFTVDQLEMRLRQQGIQRIADVKTATLEPNGQLGYELNREAQPLTVGEFEKALQLILPQISTQLQQQIQEQQRQQQTTKANEQFSLFDELRQQGHPSPNPKKLQ
jgi:uncharacterized membrane protein YcaP (DUF421 family)